MHNIALKATLLEMADYGAFSFRCRFRYIYIYIYKYICTAYSDKYKHTDLKHTTSFEVSREVIKNNQHYLKLTTTWNMECLHPKEQEVLASSKNWANCLQNGIKWGVEVRTYEGTWKTAINEEPSQQQHIAHVDTKLTYRSGLSDNYTGVQNQAIKKVIVRWQEYNDACLVLTKEAVFRLAGQYKTIVL